MHTVSECLCYLAMNTFGEIDMLMIIGNVVVIIVIKKTQKLCLDKNKTINKPYRFITVKYIRTDSFI